MLILSQYYDEDYAMRLIGGGADGVGYLLKERVGDIETFLDAVGSVAAGQCAVDPEIVSRMLGRRRTASPVDEPSLAGAGGALSHGGR